jgi:hypothetical protein
MKHTRDKEKHGIRKQGPASPRQAAPQYPVGTVAYYGPDDKTVTKVVAGIVASEEAEPIIQRWLGPKVSTDPKVLAEMAVFFGSHGVHRVAVTDGLLGCPHEEGIDFPEGQECPFCPFWRGKQGINVRK